MSGPNVTPIWPKDSSLRVIRQRLPFSFANKDSKKVMLISLFEPKHHVTNGNGLKEPKLSLSPTLVVKEGEKLIKQKVEMSFGALMQ
jgi:hypothetical protein